MSPVTRPTPLLIAAFLAVYLIWGSTYLAIRVAIETMPPFLMAGVRFGIAGLMLYAWGRLRGVPNPSRVEWRSAAIVGVLMLLGGNGLVTWAEKVVPSGLAAVLVATVPLWMAVLDPALFRGPRPSPSVATGLIMGLGGVALLLNPFGADAGVESVSVVGGIAVLIASGSWALGSLWSRTAKLPSSPAMTTAIEMITGGAALLLVGTAAGEWPAVHVAEISARSAWSFAYLIVFGSVVALSAYTYMLRHATATAVGTYAFVNPVVAVVLGALLLAEPVTSRTIAASALIVGAVIVLQVSRSRLRRPAPPIPSGTSQSPTTVSSR